MARTLIESGVNKKGTKFCVINDNGSFEVWKLCENYNGKVRGGIQKQWRYIDKGLSLDDAMALFSRRLKGTQS